MGKRTTDSTNSTERAIGVLIAEDDDAMRAFLSRTLTGMGYRVEEIASAHALETYLARSRQTPTGPTELPIDIIITGLTMPGRTVLDILRRIRSVVQTTPIVLITTLEDTTTHALALSLGATAVFDKPFNIDTLKTFLKAATETVRRRGTTATTLVDNPSL